MLERVGTRMLPVVSRYGDHAPMAAVCCNACRACTTTNAIGLALAAAGTLALSTRRVVTRVLKRS
jgi:hypothetical protein